MPVAFLKSKIYVHIDHQQKGIRGAKQANIQLWQVKQYSILFSPLSYSWKYYSTTFVLCQFVSFGIVMLMVKAEKRPTSPRVIPCVTYTQVIATKGSQPNSHTAISDIKFQKITCAITGTHRSKRCIID